MRGRGAVVLLTSLVAATLLLALAAELAGCGGARRSSVGAECELTSECDTPLVCRLAHCRNECATSGDCAAGLSCVLDPIGLGACQLPDERDCALASDCAAPLVCRFRQCVNECVEDRDCLGGARCTPAPEGGGVCIDPSTTSCVSDGECRALMPGTFCLGGRCREECHSDRDCRNDWWCDEPAQACLPPPRPDADAGSLDAGATDGSVAVDGGSFDAGPFDTGLIDGALFDGGPTDAATLDGGGVPPSTCRNGPLGPVVSFDMGGEHGCALVGRSPSLSVYCWGDTTDPSTLGQPGASPTRGMAHCATASISALDGMDIAEVATGAIASYVRMADGTVWSWGWDFFFSLGRGDGTTQRYPTPAIIPGLLATRLATGDSNDACVLRATGIAACWGPDDVALGIATATRTPLDSTVSMPDAIAIGNRHACFLSGGSVTCMGDDAFGQLGNGAGGAPITDAVAVTAGLRHSCALASAGVYCWGDNAQGQLGDGTTTPHDTRLAVIGLPEVPVAIDAGTFSTCALTAGGDVWCWGSSQGIVPAMTPVAAISTPVRVMTGASEVHVGISTTCARIGTNIACLGRSSPYLGYGDGPAPTVPVLVQR